jgi:tRNA G18 (ribose-2'-O)-methylase SpoU
MTRYNAEEIEKFWREQNSRRQQLKRTLDEKRLPYGVAVWNVTKDWNIGNLIRTANAFLCGEIVLVGNEEFDATGCASVHRFERMTHQPDPASFATYAKKQGYSIIAAEIDERAEFLPRFEYPEKPLFVLGSELSGLSDEMMDLASHRVMIPQYGLIPCLNVNVSCSILLYDYITRTYPELEPVPIEGAKFKIDPGSGQRS